MIEHPRLVVTADLPNGGSVFTHVEEVEPRRLGGDMLRYAFWGWDETPTLPVHEPRPLSEHALPDRVGGVRIERWVLPGGFPREGSHPDAGRMHATDTVDVIFVMDGELCLKTSADDREVRLRRGDIVVQNGAMHSWYNPTDEPCVLGFVFFGTTRAVEAGSETTHDSAQSERGHHDRTH